MTIKKTFWIIIFFLVTIGAFLSPRYSKPLFREFFDRSAFLIKPSLIKDQIKYRYNYRFKEIQPGENFNYDWMKTHRFVAHGMGAVESIPLTNSLEAFQYNYKKGFRVFEVDFLFSLDGKLIARHDRKYINSDNFLNSPIEGRYTPLDLAALSDLMAAHEDIYIITDTKQNFAESLETIIKKLSKENPLLLKRIIPQIYNPFDYYVAMKLFPFQSICFTLYRSSLSEKKILNFLDKSGIQCLVMPPEKVNDSFVSELAKRQVHIYVHTINDPSVADSLIQKGIWGIYTDTLGPSLPLKS